MALTFSPLSVSTSLAILYVNGVTFTEIIAASTFPISSLIIGASFLGNMQNFIIYAFPLGLESLITP